MNRYPQRYGGFLLRLGAALIDSLLFSMLSLCLLYLVYGPAHFQALLNADSTAVSGGLLEFVIDWMLPLAITVFCWLKFLGTPGKLLLGCQVVDLRSGRSLRLGQALLRYLGYFVSALPLGLGFLWIIWDKRKQGFHDKIAGTVVVLEDESRRSLADLERELL